MATKVADVQLKESYTKANGTRAFTGDQSMGDHKITDLAAPTNPNDAARLIDLKNEDFLQSKWKFLIPTSLTATVFVPFTGGVISSGGFGPWYNAVPVGDRNYEVLETNGYYYMSAGAVNNSGYRLKDAGDYSKNPYPGFTFMALLSPLELTDTTTRIGIFPTGVFTANIENLSSNSGFIITNGDVVARTSNGNNTLSTTSAPVTLIYGSWYYFFFEIQSWGGGALPSSVRYVIKDIDKITLMDVTHTTGKGGGGQQGIGVVSTRNTADVSKAILGVSYIGFGPKRPNFLNFMLT